MRMPTGSSVILATLASSASLGALVSAAPTDNQDSAAVAQAPGSDATPSTDAGGLGSLFGGLGRREVDIEPRQLAGLLNTIESIAPIVTAVLHSLGLQVKGAVDAASVLPQEQLSQIQSMVQQATGGVPVSLPGLSGGAPGNANHSTNGTNAGNGGNNGTTTTTHAPRAPPPAWVDDRRNGNGGGDTGSQGFTFPMQMDVVPGGAPIPKLPGGVFPGAPAAPVNGVPIGNNNASAPAGPQPPSPFSPGLPPNPPNTPAEAMSSPPLFNPATAEGNDTYPGNATFPANGTATSTASGEPSYPTGSA
ncbi:uncharacterized protein PHACADRAFT_84985 [Phanerochaete carnosa HHB-10118-sp]|uniref:Uncharacterized protein n=1 Tax=Phanerochaete carnosa (strain HHB-10118-sp) TaxID=650164 RepID=K5WQ20_PHACS|nr:uncharacterized protein PHACADRAFT_84985 [Phanerochaete carnosa HHB-10118-sp]EKM61575.1 hypothetical protein PHACADRAFT_84985 [Phanerochaete carnosa HHB-10118-sp]